MAFFRILITLDLSYHEGIDFLFLRYIMLALVVGNRHLPIILNVTQDGGGQVEQAQYQSVDVFCDNREA
jgi:hypothetical protein